MEAYYDALALFAITWRIYFSLVLENYFLALAWRFAFGGLEYEELVFVGDLLMETLLVTY